MPLNPPSVLVFAASDPTCGAGIQADLLTLASLGCHPLTALTALTIQDTSGVESIHPVSADLLERQARLLLDDFAVSCFKIGVLGSIDNIACVARILSDYPDIPLVLDPVLASGRGDSLADTEMICALSEQLLPLTTILTPNRPEAIRLTQAEKDANEPDNTLCAQQLLNAGAEYVLITGTHHNAPLVTNSLFGKNGLLRQDSWERLPGCYHGSGCTLASAVAAFVAAGKGMEEAVWKAQQYTWSALSQAFNLGKGQSIPNRLFLSATQDNNDIKQHHSF